MPLAPRSRPLVGRDHELGRARRAVGLEGEARAAGLVVSGDAGIGKSRLVSELAHEAEVAGHRVVTGHCIGLAGSSLAWLPFVELVGALAAELPEVVAEVTATHPDLDALGERRSGTGAVDPGRIAEAVHALLTSAARKSPLLVVVEDVHWADHSSRDLLTLLLTRGFAAPVSLVVTYRSDDLHRRHPLHEVLTVWARLPLVARVDLAPLEAPRMRELVRALDGAPSSASVLTDLVERSDGNAFFAEELVASGGTGAATDDLARLLRLRLDRLDEPARLVVRAAAVAGRTVRHALLEDVVDLDEDELDDALHQAVEHHILEPRAGDSFAFRHALLGETVADDLLPGARRRLHRAWLETLQSRSDVDSPADVARHAAAFGDLATAAAAAEAAGDAAMRVGGARDALSLYESALGWVEDDPERRARITMVASEAAEIIGDQVRSLDLLLELVDELDPTTHPIARARALGWAALKHTILDLPGDPDALSAEAVALVPARSGPAALEVRQCRLQVLIATGQDEEAARMADELTALAEELDEPGVLAEVRVHRARLLSRTDPRRAHAELTASLGEPTTTDELRLRALLRLGVLDRNAGDFEEAYEHFRTGVTIADRLRRPWGPFGMECRLQGGRTAYELGRWDEAETLLVSPPDLPQPTRGFLESALVELHAAQGRPVAPDRLDEARRWWDVDVLLVVGCLGGMIDVLGRLGRAEEMLDWVESGIAAVDRAWGEGEQAFIRLAAMLTGQAADLQPGLEPELSARLRAACEGYGERAASAEEQADLPVGPESRAWRSRLEAELLRLRRACGDGGDLAAEVAAWEAAVAAFDELPHVPEAARSRVRLAVALHAAARTDEAAEVAARARAVAERLGARPLLPLLETLVDPEAEPAEEDPGSLTPREREVLELVARGRTNGQVASELYISRKTVSTHVSNVLAKLGATTRGEAVALARDRGLLR